MNVVINGHNVTITESMEEFAEQRIKKLGRYLPNISNVTVDLSVQKTNRGADFAIAQITLRHGRGAILRTEEKIEISDRDSLKVALNYAVDKMHSRITRFKGKRKSKRLRERYKATPEEYTISEEYLDEEPLEIPVYNEYADYAEETIVRRKDIAVIAMNEEEAIQQMELLGHSFYIFFNKDTETLNLLYRRSTEGYGILIPQIE
jgi:putative sigma-54 modulation protein